MLATRSCAPSTARIASTAPVRARRARVAARAGPLDALNASIEENKRRTAAREVAKLSAPPGVPPPPFAPTIEPATFGFVENAERLNSRASMVGWWALLLVEGVAGKGLLELAGVTVGKGINFTF